MVVLSELIRPIRHLDITSHRAYPCLWQRDKRNHVDALTMHIWDASSDVLGREKGPLTGTKQPSAYFTASHTMARQQVVAQPSAISFID